MNCPECDANLGVTVMDDREDKNYRHILELCAYCGYQKAYVDYLDNDTGPIDWSGIEY